MKYNKKITVGSQQSAADRYGIRDQGYGIREEGYGSWGLEFGTWDSFGTWNKDIILHIVNP